MSERLECPGCGTETSSVLAAVSEWRPCPYCDLSAQAIVEVTRVQHQRGSAELRERVAELLIENDRLKSELGRLHRFRRAILNAVAEEAP